MLSMENYIATYETGIDYNNDGHCDLDGWFLDEYENHRARLIRHERVKEERIAWSYRDHKLGLLTAEEYTSIFIQDSPYGKADYNPTKYKTILAYSENVEDKMSCSAINGYLRNGIVQSGLSEGQIKDFVDNMNSCISDFTVGKTMTVFRGMRLPPNSSLQHFFDEVLNRMQYSQKPALFVEKGFMSTTRNVKTMENYASHDNLNFTHVFMSITLEPGIKAMPLSQTYATATKKNDKEILLRSGGVYYIVGMKRVHTGNGLYDYFIHLIATNRRIETC